ncbi:ATP-binding cassette domain-containing protein [Lactococcus kimchii]|uniref:ATP-binding cassette domain-containing protein n=1 Tax=Lactococcus sp. S-13 TaxID=2507158 RepID=UPI001022B874|nr:ABC transporter ATP-binding protein [Lactococcus sp. S-13]RZI48658.1 ABC transporter ATP-binding protein [Lactococcus sp. S-13]
MLKLFKFLPTKAKIVLIFMSVISSAYVLIQPIIIKNAMNLSNKSDLSDVLHFGLYGFLIYIILYFISFLSNVSTNYSMTTILVNLHQTILKRILKNSLEFKNSEKISLLTQDLEFLYGTYIEPWGMLFTWGIIFITTALYLIYSNIILGPIFILGSLLIPIPQMVLGKRLNALGELYYSKRGVALEKIMDAVNGRQTLKNNQGIERAINRVQSAVEERENARKWSAYTSNLIFSFRGLTNFLGQVLPLVIGFLMNLHGANIPVAALIAMFVAAQQASQPIQTILYQIQYLQEAKTTKERFFNLLDTPEVEGEKLPMVKGIKQLCVGSVNKSFSSKIIFHDFTYIFEMGKKYLIRGASGSGKSTLFRLINQELAVDKGEITVVTQENKKYSQFQNNIGIISQTPFLFNDTIRYNLTFDDDYSELELLSALEQVGLVSEFENILDIKIENNGENISGGQRVRIELARCLLRKKNILLIDEVTASLDDENAYKVRKLILNLPVLVIEIAHHFDKRFVYDKIIEL